MHALDLKNNPVIQLPAQSCKRSPQSFPDHTHTHTHTHTQRKEDSCQAKCQNYHIFGTSPSELAPYYTGRKAGAATVYICMYSLYVYTSISYICMFQFNTKLFNIDHWFSQFCFRFIVREKWSAHRILYLPIVRELQPSNRRKRRNRQTQARV